MDIKKCTLPPFTVIGLVGKSTDGPGYVDKLWMEINRKGKSIMHLVKKDEDGDLAGVWGLMNDETGTFLPPGDKKSKTVVYMAGLEVNDNAKAPKGFEKWVIPEFDYLYVPVEGKKLQVIEAVMEYCAEENLVFAACPFDYMPADGKMMYMFFPVKPDPEMDE